jgi:hypothetical protein
MGTPREKVKLGSKSKIQASAVQNAKDASNGAAKQEFFSIGELAWRWRISRGTVYNRLRAIGAKVLDFAAPGKKSKKAVPALVVQQIESMKTKRLV